jgi:hypothetical protein
MIPWNKILFATVWLNSKYAGKRNLENAYVPNWERKHFHSSCRHKVPSKWCYFFLVGWDLRHQVLRPLLAYCTSPNDRWGWLWSNWWNEDWQGKPKYSEKTCPSATLSTTNQMMILMYHILSRWTNDSWRKFFVVFFFRPARPIAG